MSVFTVGNPVYMVSANNTGGWIAGKVYRAVIVSKNDDNLNIRFDSDGAEMTVPSAQLQNISLNVNPPIVGLNQATLFTAFEQQKKSPNTYFKILRNSHKLQTLDTQNTANILLELKKGGRKSRQYKK